MELLLPSIDGAPAAAVSFRIEAGLHLQCAHQISNLVDALAPAEFAQLARDSQRRGGIPEVRGADLDRGGSGDQEFGRVLAGGDAAQSDDGDLHRAGGLADETQGDRLDGRSGEAAEAGADARTARPGVDGEG